jgi:hypothetical protein
MLTIAEIAAESIGPGPCQSTRSPARQVGLNRTVTGAARRVLRWLALRGSPAGNRARPDILATHRLDDRLERKALAHLFLILPPGIRASGANSGCQKSTRLPLAAERTASDYGERTVRRDLQKWPLKPVLAEPILPVILIL